MAKCNFLKVSYTLIGRKLTKTALSSQTFAGIFQKFLHQHFGLSVRCCPNMSFWAYELMGFYFLKAFLGKERGSLIFWGKKQWVRK